MKIFKCQAGTRHAGCPAKPLVVSLEMRSFHSKKEVRLQGGEFIWLHHYVGYSKTQGKIWLPFHRADPGYELELLMYLLPYPHLLHVSPICFAFQTLLRI